MTHLPTPKTPSSHPPSPDIVEVAASRLPAGENRPNRASEETQTQFNFKVSPLKAEFSFARKIKKLFSRDD
jgi:hypothetical protein